MSRQALVAVAVMAWVLWLDQAPYDLPARGRRPAQIMGEGVPGNRVQIAVTATRAECEALRQAQVTARERQVGPDERGYPVRHRFLCAPAP